MKHESLANHFLVAMPQLEGSFFGKSVIYIWQHSVEGALGLVVNQPLQLRLDDVLEQLDLEDQRPLSASQTVLSGGPVETDKGFILHDSPSPWESTLKLKDGIYLTTSKDILQDISRNAGPENYLLALGCSGWSAGQLDDEIADNSWLTCPASKEVIFSSDFANKPDLATASLGFTMAQLTPEAGQS